MVSCDHCSEPSNVKFLDKLSNCYLLKKNSAHGVNSCAISMRSLRKVHEVTHIPEILSASLQVLPVKLVLNVYL